MREGTAVTDFLEPSMTIIGAANKAHSAMVRGLYAWAHIRDRIPFGGNGEVRL